MTRLRVNVAVRSAAPVERVWAVLADARRWREWTAFSTTELEREGSPDPDGVGALRRFRRGPVTSREEVTGFEPPHRLTYELRSGLPVRGYRAVVTLAPSEGGTEISWQSRFEPRIPGTGGLLRVVLDRVITDVATRLARRAEQVP
ncbi:MAG: Polyketide cyclase/dehydrase [Chloroflexi bacterium]|nr:Polyketide cyclase/dehydrase [Chloroflexota bacterium]